jgi:2-isopropylmalate synthase
LTEDVGKQPPLLGIHAHNDCGLALANSIVAVQEGCVHAQGTLAGFGERCGNTALAALIPSLELKLGLRCLPEGKLKRITELARTVAEIANVSLGEDMPYVGAHAFSHKAGMHADGILKVRESFEHIDPRAAGNGRHFPVSEAGGRASIAERARRVDAAITKEHPAVAALAGKLKRLEAEGWAFEGADASFELLVRRELGRHRPLFRIEAYRVMSEHPAGEGLACSHAWVKVLVDGQHEIAAAEGEGPVNALDGALRRALVRVLIETTDGQPSWSTVGVSADIIDASRAALVDSIEWKLRGEEGEIRRN